ncbi:helix-turn-helix domain-containing protein [Saccharomonospora sp. NPDC046836]|uniref:winged helix-turn-helix transcriptional regulator n=1 Tax=Saccharomonospora sp. NPDC046836 TaxID=3156921 RepID=UPI0033C69301
MRRVSFRNMHCSVAQCLEVVGEWWTLLIVRDALLGVARFEDFHDRLGIARNVLNQRLITLVEAGVLERVQYSEHPPRDEYRLTPKGRDLWLVIAALREWGDRWAAPDGSPLHLVHRACGEITEIVPTCSACGETVTDRDLKAIAGRGMRDSLLPAGRA